MTRVHDHDLDRALASLRERLDALEVEIDGPRPLPVARVGRASNRFGGLLRRAWDWWRSRRATAKRLELGTGEPSGGPVVELRRPWSRPMCFVIDDDPVHVYQMGQPRCACGLSKVERPEPTIIPGPGEPCSR